MWRDRPIDMASILSTTAAAQAGVGPKPAGRPDESLIVLPQPAENPPG